MYKHKIKEFRNFKNLTQKQLSLRSGVSQNYISEIENYKYDLTVTTLVLICLGLEVTPNKILNWEVNLNEENIRREIYNFKG